MRVPIWKSCLKIEVRMKKFITIAALFLSLSMAACASAGGREALPEDAGFRYKMTIAVETPEGLRTGSAVRQVVIRSGLSPLPESQASVRVKGEAVVVDLGSRGVLFGLLSGYFLGSDHASDLPGYVYFPKGGWLSADGNRRMKEIEKGNPVELPPKWYPKLVRFKDASDPKTVEMLLEVKPCEGQPAAQKDRQYCVYNDRFEEAFGEGVRLKSISIEMTDEPVTEVIYTVIPPIENVKDKYLDGQFLGGGPELSNILHVGDFRKGDKK